MGSSGQDSVWAGTFQGFLNLSNITTLDWGRGRAGIRKIWQTLFRDSREVPTDPGVGAGQE